jgi:hypothetical protein
MKEKMMRQKSLKKTVRREAGLAGLTAALLLALPGASNAMDIDTGNDAIKLRWDNTIRYNLGFRMRDVNPGIYNDPIADEGDALFSKHDVVTNRIDLLSEMDLVYQDRWGGRLSAAGWYDNAYNGKRPTGNPALLVPNLPAAGPFPPLRQALPNGGQLLSYDNAEYSPYTKRYYEGPSGELLDAFLFGKFDAADVPVTIKAGRHTVYWGESLLLGGVIHGIAYSQMPIDLQKGFATPGAEGKELFRPLGHVSAQAQITPELSLAAQVFFQWESFRYPEGGTYLGPVDFAFNGPDRQIATAALSPTTTAIINASRVGPSEPSNTGEGGLAARWSPAWLDGTLGFYYRRYADKLPQVFLTSLDTAHPFYANKIGNTTFVGVNGTYRAIYADDIDLFGVSLAKNIAGVSIGAELSYRHNTPLISQTLGNVVGVQFNEGDTPGPRGDTMHGLINAFGVVPKTALFDSATYQAEMTWNTYTKVQDKGSALFQAEGHPLCNPGGPLVQFASPRDSGCASRNFVGLAANFTPTWFSVIPSGDFSMPITWSQGIYGNSSVSFGGNQGTGNYSIGGALDYLQKYRFDLKYIGFYGKLNQNPATGAVASQNGFFTLIDDRGFINFTFKTTF